MSKTLIKINNNYKISNQSLKAKENVKVPCHLWEKQICLRMIRQ